MKRILEDGQPASRALVDAMRGIGADPFLEERVLSRIRSKSRRIPRRAWRPMGIVAGVSILALVSAASAMVWRVTHRPPAPVIVETPIAPAPRAVVPAPPQPVIEPPKPHRPRVEKRSTPVEISHATQLAAPSAEESELLLAAYQAHRQAHDDHAALARVDEYLTRFPHGRLAEEALIIALDATKSTPALSISYARSYLARFPTGAQADRARAILDPR